MAERLSVADKVRERLKSLEIENNPKRYFKDESKDNRSSQQGVHKRKSFEDPEMLELVLRLERAENVLKTMTAELQETLKVIKMKDEEISSLRSQVSSKTSKESNVLEVEKDKLLKRIGKMERMLSDWGLIWVGADAANEDSDEVLYRKTKVTFSDNPEEFKVEELPLVPLQASGTSDAVVNCDIVDLVLYSNGLVVDNGRFRKYDTPSVTAFCQDVQEGYYPTELKASHPDGVVFHVIDKRKESYTGSGETEIVSKEFPGEGKLLGSKQLSGGSTTVDDEKKKKSLQILSEEVKTADSQFKSRSRHSKSGEEFNQKEDGVSESRKKSDTNEDTKHVQKGVETPDQKEENVLEQRKKSNTDEESGKKPTQTDASTSEFRDIETRRKSDVATEPGKKPLLRYAETLYIKRDGEAKPQLKLAQEEVTESTKNTLDTVLSDGEVLAHAKTFLHVVDSAEKEVIVKGKMSNKKKHVAKKTAGAKGEKSTGVRKIQRGGGRATAGVGLKKKGGPEGIKSDAKANPATKPPETKDTDIPKPKDSLKESGKTLLLESKKDIEPKEHAIENEPPGVVSSGSENIPMKNDNVDSVKPTQKGSAKVEKELNKGSTSGKPLIEKDETVQPPWGKSIPEEKDGDKKAAPEESNEQNSALLKDETPYSRKKSLSAEKDEGSTSGDQNKEAVEPRRKSVPVEEEPKLEKPEGETTAAGPQRKSLSAEKDRDRRSASEKPEDQEETEELQRNSLTVEKERGRRSTSDKPLVPKDEDEKPLRKSQSVENELKLFENISKEKHITGKRPRSSKKKEIKL